MVVGKRFSAKLKQEFEYEMNTFLKKMKNLIIFN